jgi:hypothetical protein
MQLPIVSGTGALQHLRQCGSWGFQSRGVSGLPWMFQACTINVEYVYIRWHELVAHEAPRSFTNVRSTRQNGPS